MMDLGKITKNWDNFQQVIPTLIVNYDEDIALAPTRLSISGKTGNDVIQEQCAWPVYYGQRLSEITKLANFVELRINFVRGSLYRQFTENHSRGLSERCKDQYINNEPAYIDIYRIFLEVDEVKQKLKAICDAFDRRGFAIRDWTQLRVNELQHSVI
jgi:hypothetical protein